MKKYILFLFLFFCIAPTLMGQEKQFTISGHVFDEIKEPIPGVQCISERPCQEWVSSTNIDGAFKLTAHAGDVVIFSFIGFKKIEHLVLKDELDLKINMKSVRNKWTKSLSPVWVPKKRKSI